MAGCDPLWIEVKRRKSIAACRFMDQCDEDTKIPTASRWYLCGKTVGNG